MDYKWHYVQLIRTRRSRVLKDTEYYENHHIVPRSLGGDDSPENLIKLTAREHFIAHWLLWRIYRNNKMAYAFFLMAAGIKKNGKISFSSIAYDEAKQAKSAAVSELNQKIKRGHTKSAETLKRMSIAQKGRVKSEDHKRKISESNKGKPKSAEHRQKLSDSNNGFDWTSYTDRNRLISIKNTGASNGRARGVQMLDEFGNLIMKFPTMKDAFEYINKNNKVSKTTFYRKIINESVFHGFYWKFIN